MDQAFDTARRILAENRLTLEKSARDLLEQESLSEDALGPYFEVLKSPDRPMPS